MVILVYLLEFVKRVNITQMICRLAVSMKFIFVISYSFVHLNYPNSLKKPTKSVCCFVFEIFVLDFLFELYVLVSF